MREMTCEEQILVNGGAVGPKYIYSDVYRGISFKWINPTGVFSYKGYKNGKYVYYCPNAIY